MNKLIDSIQSAKLGEIDEATLIRLARRTSVDVEDMANLEIMSQDEETELWNKIHSGDDEAKSRLIDAHIPLVTTIALDYLDSDNTYLELIDMGMRGLEEAVRRYDVRVGYQFAVHAVWWIRQTIVRGAKQTS